jgi:hypothetical protein
VVYKESKIEGKDIDAFYKEHATQPAPMYLRAFFFILQSRAYLYLKGKQKRLKAGLVRLGPANDKRTLQTGLHGMLTDITNRKVLLPEIFFIMLMPLQYL